MLYSRSTGYAGGILREKDAVGAAPIRVIRVVVVDIAGRVDVPGVVTIATIRGRQAHILRSAYILCTCYSNFEYLPLSDLTQFRILSLRSITILPQYIIRFVSK